MATLTLFNDYLRLGKFRLSLLVLFTAAIGYGLGTNHFDLITYFSLLLGTLLSAMGANGLNQWWEREHDAQMQRTKQRPIPSGSISANAALLVTGSWALCGITVLYYFVNLLTAFLAAASFCIYLFLYTPLKRLSPIAILVGAIPGAIPPIMGWTAATGAFSIQAWGLGCILYLWQIPHFMSLATLYRQDYWSGGFRLIPDDPAVEKATRSIILVFCIALLGISLLTPYIGLGRWLFFAGAAMAGLWMLALAFRFYRTFSLANAKALFFSSIIYLPVVLILLLIDQKVPLS